MGLHSHREIDNKEINEYMLCGMDITSPSGGVVSQAAEHRCNRGSRGRGRGGAGAGAGQERSRGWSRALSQRGTEDSSGPAAKGAAPQTRLGPDLMTD